MLVTVAGAARAIRSPSRRPPTRPPNTIRAAAKSRGTYSATPLNHSATTGNPSGMITASVSSDSRTSPDNSESCCRNMADTMAGPPRLVHIR